MATTAQKALTKSQFMARVADAVGLPRTQVQACLASAFDVAAKETRTKGLSVIPGFGRLRRVARKARLGRNPMTGDTIKIPAKTVLRFRVAKAYAASILPVKRKS